MTKGKLCAHCRSLRPNRQIDCARKYERLAKRLDAALATGTLVADDPEPDSVPWWMRSELPYAEMRCNELSGAGMPDGFNYYFRCTDCGTRFNLSIDIYHGAGGPWQIVDSRGRRLTRRK